MTAQEAEKRSARYRESRLMPTEESAKLHGDKLESHEDRDAETNTKTTQDDLAIPEPKEHQAAESMKLHGDKLEHKGE